MAQDPKQTLKSIKSGLLSRGLALAKVSVSAGAKAASHALGGILGPEEEKGDRIKALLASQMDLLARELGQLKGSVMKVGQMLSMYGEHLLPPEANAVLKQLQNQSPPLEWEAIERVLLQELGFEKLAELEIEETSHASASLGQVHRATIRETGEKLALKIQYPGVDRAIDSDLSALRRILSVSRILPKVDRYDSLFQEVREMLKQEVDYTREAKFTNEFAARIQKDSRYRVARVFERYSTERVIATEFLEGVGVDSPEVAALSQQRRDALGKAFFELYLRELFDFRSMQTDPHFGNYRIQIDPQGEADRLVLLDFGAMREIPEGFVDSYRVMVRGALQESRVELEAGALALGFIQADDPQELKDAFAGLCFLFGEPFRDPAYDWNASDLPKRVIAAGSKLAFFPKFSLRAPPREIVFLDRKLGGVFIFLSVLRVRTDLRPSLLRAVG
jgi:predicted unusual protein kinase regulating ubiquinone biosynthesis (AarF/ABC1/UbiB family)